MKGFSVNKYIYFVLLLMSSAWVQAQIDLEVLDIGGPYSFPGDGQSHMVNLMISNNGNQDAVAGVTLNFTEDGSVDPSFGFDPNVFSSEWDCPAFDVNKTCTYIGTFAQGTMTFLDVGVVVQPGIFDFAPAFSVQVVDDNGDEINLANNVASVDIQYTTGSQTDFSVNLQNPQPVTFPVAQPGPTEFRTMSFDITNLGPNDEGDQTTVTFDIAPALDGIAPASASSSDPAWNCIQTTGQVICDYFSIYTTGLTTTLDLQIPAPTTAGPVTNAVGVSMFNVLGDINPANNTFQYDVDFTAGPGAAEIEVTKVINGGLTSAPWGTNVTYTVEVNNTGTATANNVALTDTIPPGVSYVSHQNLGPNFICSFAAPTISCNAPTLPNTAAVDGVEITVLVDGNVSDLVTNTASSPFADGDSLNNSDSVSFVIDPFSADLSSTKTVNGATTVTEGDPVEFTIGIVNNGPDDAFDVQLIDDIPVGLTFDAIVTETGISCVFAGGNNQVICDAPTLTSGNSHTAVVRFLTNATGATTNTVTSVSTNPAHFDPFTSDANQATANINIVGPSADLDLTMVADNTTYLVGDLVTLDLTLHNPFASTGAPPNTSVTTTLPAEVVFSSAQVTNVGGWSCVHDGSPAGGDVVCDSQGNPVPIGTNTLIEIIAAAASAGTTITPSAVVTSDFDPNPSNDTASTSFAINPATADLSLIFTSTGGLYVQGDQIAYTAQVANPMVSTANPSDTEVTFNLPFEVIFSSTDVSGAPGWNCIHDGAPSGGDVFCDRGGAAFISNSVDDITVNVLADQVATNAIVTATISSAADINPGNNTANQADVINPAVSDFSIAKTVNGTNFVIGDTFTYVLTVNNPGGSTANPTDVVIEDQLPAEVSFDNFVVGTNLGTPLSCVHDGANTGGQVTCDTGGAPFPVNETVTVDINVTAASANNNVNNTATVETSTDPDGVANNNNDNAPTVVITGPLLTTLTANKAATVAGVTVTEVAYGQAFEYTLEVTNTGANDSINTHISDTLPPEVTLDGFNITGWNCLPLTVGNVGEVVDCTLAAPLVAGNTAQIVLVVTATNNTSVTSITNQMEASGDNTGALVNDTNILSLTQASASLVLTQQPSPVDPGANVTFDVQFNNTGGINLSGAQLNAQLPVGFVYQGFNSDPSTSCTENNGLVSCLSNNPITPGASMTVSLDAITIGEVQANQNYQLSVQANAAELSVPVNASLVTLFSGSDFRVVMRSIPAEINPGDPMTHQAAITNTGNLNLKSVRMDFNVPPNATLSAIQPLQMTCLLNDMQVTCVNQRDVAPGERLIVDYMLQSNPQSTGLISSTVQVMADGISQTASTSTQVSGAQFTNDLSLQKTANQNQVRPGDLFQYQLTVTNLGSNEQAPVTVTDDLPVGVSLRSVNGTGWNCQGSSSLVCTYSNTLNPGASSSLFLNVAAPDQTGIITNTARVSGQADDNPANNESAVSVQVSDGQGGGDVQADIGVLVSTNQPEVIIGEPVTWRFELFNQGPQTAPNVQLDNLFPNGFSADNVVVNNGAECILMSNRLNCQLSALAVGSPVFIELTGRFSAASIGLSLNRVTVVSDATDTNLDNNESEVEVNVVDTPELEADVAIELLAEVQDIRQGEAFNWSLRATNLGPDQAADVQVSATINGLVSDVQVLNSAGWECQASNNSLQCQYPGALMVGLGSTIDLRVITDQVVQQSQPIGISASITTTATDNNLANNQATIDNAVRRTPTEDEIFNLFDGAIGSGASETVKNTIRNVSSYCARSYFTAIEGLCEEFITAARPENREDIINAMEEMTPNEVVGQSTSAAEIITSQLRNVSARLAQLKAGGGSGFSIAGLNGRYGNESIPLGMLAYLNQSEEETGSVSNINDFVSPWGFFVNGTISMGERDATGRELGFDFDTFGLTAGVDYRFSPTKVAGVALGYAHFDSEIQDEAEMKSTGFTLTGYGSMYLKDNLYLDARLSYGNPDFEQQRRIHFSLDDIQIDRIATGKTDASQYSVAMSMGYHFNKNSWNITPNASVNYARTTIDGFAETGAGGFNFAFAEQEVKSLVWSVGASVSRAISLKNGVLAPQFDFNISRETENDGGFLEARFIGAPDDEIFFIGTDEPDRTYGSAGVGLVFIGANGKQAYINYRSIFGLEGFTRGTINIGARFEF
ncbi:autotransporter domain-containing protein [Marinicella sediminis]|uniref:Autotransporter domain-containing protein n=1 Tax=Marinicella sediminis TaxID=1792834 RepID=A0ABV7J9C3_9GAMM|nr:autotransporter domain-containing protein [Marinicella sediminis]